MNVFETLTINLEKYIKKQKNTSLKIFGSWVWQSTILIQKRARSGALCKYINIHMLKQTIINVKRTIYFMFMKFSVDL